MKFSMSFSGMFALILMMAGPATPMSLAEEPQTLIAATSDVDSVEVQAPEIDEPEVDEAEISEPEAEETDSSDISESSPRRALDFLRALNKISKQETHNLQSDMILRISSGGLSISSEMNIETLIGPENQFNSLLTYENPANTEQKTFRVISNGDNVWIHDLAQNIYSVMPYAKFQADYSDRMFIGLYNTFLIPLKKSLGLDDTFKNIPDDSILELLEVGGIAEELASTLSQENIKIGSEEVEGVALTTVSFEDATDNFSMKMFIEPNSAQIQDISLIGDQDQFKFSIEESISQKDTPIAENFSEQFLFTPPESAALSDNPISIAPF